MARKFDYNKLGPNAKKFAELASNILDDYMSNYIEEMKEDTGMDVNVTYQLTFSLPQLLDLDEHFDYLLWNRLMGWNDRPKRV
jgi:hypothetical protein